MGKVSRRKKVANLAALVQYCASILFVTRPFEGLPREVEFIAMREIIPCATLTARTSTDHSFMDSDSVTVLPDGRSVMVRDDGRIPVALQTRSNSDDLSYNAGAMLLNVISMKQNGDEGPVDSGVYDPPEQLWDTLDPNSFGEMVLEESFALWLNSGGDWDEATHRVLEEGHNEIIPTVKVGDVEDVYWCEMNRNFIRYLSDIEESPLFDALTRVQAAREVDLDEGSRFIGAFRTCDITIPVFEPAKSVRVEDIVKEAGVLEEAAVTTLKMEEPLTPEERRACQGMVPHQMTIC